MNWKSTIYMSGEVRIKHQTEYMYTPTSTVFKLCFYLQQLNNSLPKVLAIGTDRDVSAVELWEETRVYALKTHLSIPVTTNVFCTLTLRFRLQVTVVRGQNVNHRASQTARFARFDIPSYRTRVDVFHLVLGIRGSRFNKTFVPMSLYLWSLYAVGVSVVTRFPMFSWPCC